MFGSKLYLLVLNKIGVLLLMSSVQLGCCHAASKEWKDPIQPKAFRVSQLKFNLLEQRKCIDGFGIGERHHIWGRLVGIWSEPSCQIGTGYRYLLEGYHPSQANFWGAYIHASPYGYVESFERLGWRIGLEAAQPNWQGTLNVYGCHPIKKPKVKALEYQEAPLGVSARISGYFMQRMGTFGRLNPFVFAAYTGVQRIQTGTIKETTICRVKNAGLGIRWEYSYLAVEGQASWDSMKPGAFLGASYQLGLQIRLVGPHKVMGSYPTHRVYEMPQGYQPNYAWVRNLQDPVSRQQRTSSEMRELASVKVGLQSKEEQESEPSSSHEEMSPSSGHGIKRRRGQGMSVLDNKLERYVKGLDGECSDRLTEVEPLPMERGSDLFSDNEESYDSIGSGDTQPSHRQTSNSSPAKKGTSSEAQEDAAETYAASQIRLPSDLTPASSRTSSERGGVSGDTPEKGVSDYTADQARSAQDLTSPLTQKRPASKTPRSSSSIESTASTPEKKSTRIDRSEEGLSVYASDRVPAEPDLTSPTAQAPPVSRVFPSAFHEASPASRLVEVMGTSQALGTMKQAVASPIRVQVNERTELRSTTQPSDDEVE